MGKTNYKKRLWKVFSEYIRRRDADYRGYCQCISCGKLAQWKQMDAGHYIPKSDGLSIYFEEKNVHAQCRSCNSFRHGNQDDYALALKRKYGDQILEELAYKKKHITRFSDFDYQQMIKIYKEKIELL